MVNCFQSFEFAIWGLFILGMAIAGFISYGDSR